MSKLFTANSAVCNCSQFNRQLFATFSPFERSCRINFFNSNHFLITVRSCFKSTAWGSVLWQKFEVVGREWRRFRTILPKFRPQGRTIKLPMTKNCKVWALRAFTLLLSILGPLFISRPSSKYSNVFFVMIVNFEIFALQFQALRRLWSSCGLRKQ